MEDRRLLLHVAGRLGGACLLVDRRLLLHVARRLGGASLLVNRRLVLHEARRLGDSLVVHTLDVLGELVLLVVLVELTTLCVALV